MVQRRASRAPGAKLNGLFQRIPVLKPESGEALDDLTEAYRDSQPAILVVSRWASNGAFLIDRFLETVPNARVARMSEPCKGPDETLRSLLLALGEKPGNVRREVLDAELLRFLRAQKKVGNRTIVCFEGPGEIGEWAVHQARELVDLETCENLGLTIILSGGPGLKELLSKPPFDSIGAVVGRPVVATQFTIEETRQYIAHQMRAAGVSDVGELFDFTALTVIHEMCSGVADNVDALCGRCIEMADEAGSFPVSTALVRLAFNELQKTRVKEKPPAPKPKKKAAPADATGRLIARMNGIVREFPVTSGHMLIGRDNFCDIPVMSPIVSRRHALVVNSGSGIGLLDLGSKNGTFVDGRRVEQHVLKSGDLIAVGDCTITYFAAKDG